jgi:hypothetical protein
MLSNLIFPLSAWAFDGTVTFGAVPPLMTKSTCASST